MNKFYGTKAIMARPMTRGQYNDYRHWTLPADECEDDDGYLIEDLDGGKPNVAGHAGYVSWSPKEQFEATYQPITAMSFGHAIKALKDGQRVARAGWNGKGMWLSLFDKMHSVAMKGEFVTLESFIVMRTAPGGFQPGWLASQADMLADDWLIVEV